MRTFEYDRLDRRTYENWLDGPTEIAELAWEYDALGRITLASDTQDKNTTPDTYVETFVYDDVGRVTRRNNYETLVVDPAIPQVAQFFKYDQIDGSGLMGTDYKQFLFRFDPVTEANEHQALNTRLAADRLGRLVQIADTANATLGTIEKQVDFTYDRADQLTRVARTTSGQAPGADNFWLTTTYDYDRAGRLTDLAHQSSGTTSGAAPFSAFTSSTFVYDRADRIVAQSTKHDQTVGAFADGSVPATDVSFFTFDDAGQLTEVVENSAIVEDYAYDSGGNREDAGVITIGEQNRLTADADFTYTYDSEGNLTRRDAVGSSAYTTYEWDYRNRLTQVKEYDASSTLTAQLDTRYNADDQLVERARQGLVLGFFIETAHDHYVYSGNELALTLNIGGDLQHRTTWGPGVDQLLIDEVFTPNGSVLQDTLWAATDHLGSVNQLVDENGKVVEHRDYDSFGALDAAFDEAGAAKNPALLDSDFGFAGRRYDATSELYYNRARWYDPTTGRFIGEDPAQDGSNWYAYANNDPVNFRDPNGLSAAGHPLAGGFGSGVTRPRNTNIGSGATFNGSNFANDAASAIGSNNSFGSFATPTFTTPSGAFSDFNTSSFASPSFSTSTFSSGFDTPNFSNILNNGPAAPSLGDFGPSFSSSSSSNSGLQFLPDNVSATPRTLNVATDIAGKPLQTLIANINGERAIFDANSKVRIGTVQDIVGEGGTTFKNVPVMFGQGTPVIFENPSTLTLGLQGFGGLGAVTKAKGIVTLGKEIIETGAELLVERLSGVSIPLINPKTFKPSKDLGATVNNAVPVATTKRGKKIISSNHLQSAAGETQLIQTLRQSSDHVILSTNRTVTSNGADVITFNKKTGRVTFFDNKSTIGNKPKVDGTRSPKKINPSKTFTNTDRFSGVLQDARDLIRQSGLSEADQTRALQSLRDNTFLKVTTGSGNAKNSTFSIGK